jgi:hypothetical protein
LCRLLPRSHGLPRISAGSASALWISRPAQASLTFRPAGSLGRQKRPLSPRLRPVRFPVQAARQLPDQSTTLWAEPSSAGDTRLGGAPKRTQFGSGYRGPADPYRDPHTGDAGTWQTFTSGRAYSGPVSSEPICSEPVYGGARIQRTRTQHRIQRARIRRGPYTGDPRARIRQPPQLGSAKIARSLFLNLIQKTKELQCVKLSGFRISTQAKTSTLEEIEGSAAVSLALSAPPRRLLSPMCAFHPKVDIRFAILNDKRTPLRPRVPPPPPLSWGGK